MQDSEAVGVHIMVEEEEAIAAAPEVQVIVVETNAEAEAEEATAEVARTALRKVEETRSRTAKSSSLGQLTENADIQKITHILSVITEQFSRGMFFARLRHVSYSIAYSEC